MFAKKSLISHLGRTAMIAGVAAIVLTAVEPTLGGCRARQRRKA